MVETVQLCDPRESPTVSTAMERHMKQLDVTTMGNNFSCKNSRLMATVSKLSSGLNKARTIESFKTEQGKHKASKGKQSIKDVINESFAK